MRSGVRLSPLKASRDRKDLKFRSGTKMHDGISSRVGSASVTSTTSRVSGTVGSHHYVLFGLLIGLFPY